MKRVTIQPYYWRLVFWLVRCNIGLDREMRCIEIAIGALGVGVLVQVSYRKAR